MPDNGRHGLIVGRAMICVASVCEPATLKVTVVPGCAASNANPIARKAPSREAAAKTTSSAGASFAPV